MTYLINSSLTFSLFSGTLENLNQNEMDLLRKQWTVYVEAGCTNLLVLKSTGELWKG